MNRAPIVRIWAGRLSSPFKFNYWPITSLTIIPKPTQVIVNQAIVRIFFTYHQLRERRNPFVSTFPGLTKQTVEIVKMVFQSDDFHPIFSCLERTRFKALLRLMLENIVAQLRFKIKNKYTIAISRKTPEYLHVF